MKGSTSAHLNRLSTLYTHIYKNGQITANISVHSKVNPSQYLWTKPKITLHYVLILVFAAVLLLPFLSVLHADLINPPVRPPRSCSLANPNDLLFLVNKTKQHSIAASFAPDDLLHIPRKRMVPGHTGELRAEANAALLQMLRSAEHQQYEIRVLSAYRSFATQKSLFRSKLKKYGEKRANRLSAAPGHSQHQLGTTVDLSLRPLRWRISQYFDDLPAGKWLLAHSHKFGFVLSYGKRLEKVTGYVHEPWHYRYIGIIAATEMAASHLSLEPYLGACSRCPTVLSCGN